MTAYLYQKTTWKKGEMIRYIKDLWKDQSGKTVYEEFLEINAKYDSQKSKFKKDYDCGLKFFNQLNT